MQEEASRYITIQPEFLKYYTKMEIKLNVKCVALHQGGKMEVVEEFYVTLYQALFTHV
jgi:hypothetical protein